MQEFYEKKVGMHKHWTWTLTDQSENVRFKLFYLILDQENQFNIGMEVFVFWKALLCLEKQAEERNEKTIEHEKSILVLT